MRGPRRARPARAAVERAVGTPPPPDPVARARSLLRERRFADAAHLLDSLHRQAPEDPELNTLLGQAALGLGDTETALDHFNLALHYDPHAEAALNGRVEALERRGESLLAEGAYETFLARNPAHRGATVALAWRLYRRGQRDAAARLLEEFLLVDPLAKDALNLLGLILAREYGEFARGERLLRKAIGLDAGFDAARANLGWVLGETRQYREALDCLAAVLARRPDDHETRLMRAHLNLKRGDFAAGWDEFEARHHGADAVARPAAFPRWNGEPLDGRTLLVSAEQGIGDQIMFASCLPDLLADARTRGARCVVEAEPRLVPLFERSFPGALVCAHTAQRAGAPRTADFEIPIGSLPSMYRRSPGAFPDHRGYLKADPARVAHWKRRLRALGPRPHVGISWRGGAPANRRQLRSIPLQQWAPLLRECGTAVSLQYGEHQDEIVGVSSSAGVKLEHWPEVIGDYDDTAALVCALDLVVSVCTAIVHLSGALGRPVWVLVPWAPEWRYLAQGNRMPWYPGARLFRQRVPEEWGPVLAEVSGQLSRSKVAGEGDAPGQFLP